MARRRRPPRPGALNDLSPLRILTQIAMLQMSYYGVAIILIVFTTLISGKHIRPGDFLDWRNVRGDVTTGWTLGLCWMLDALITVIPILLLIARSKLVPDFALTIHFNHLVVTSLYTRSIPTGLYWWALQLCSSALMISLGMWACQWRELKPFAFGALVDEATNGNITSGGAGEDAGFVMGSSSSKGADGSGEYEMVGIASSKPK